MKRTLKRELQVPEIAGLEADGTIFGEKVAACSGRAADQYRKGCRLAIL